MKKVFVVTSGSYSDYRIEAVFSTQAKADAFIAKRKQYKGVFRAYYDDAEIEEYDLDLPPKTWVGTRVRMSKEGEVIDSEVCFNTTVGFHCFDIKGNLVWQVATENLTKAIKVVNEKRAQIIALNLWNNYTLNPEDAATAINKLNED